MWHQTSLVTQLWKKIKKVLLAEYQKLFDDGTTLQTSASQGFGTPVAATDTTDKQKYDKLTQKNLAVRFCILSHANFNFDFLFLCKIKIHA